MRTSQFEHPRLVRAAAFGVVLGICVSAPQLAIGQNTNKQTAAEPNGFFARVFDRIERDIEAAVTTNKPPVPVPVRWTASKVGTLDVGAIALALESLDLDRDGREELLVLTSAELLVVGIDRSAGKKLEIQARAPLPSKAALVRSREPIGTIVVTPATEAEPASILVRSSEQDIGARFRWSSDRLRQVGEVQRFPLCHGISAELAVGYSHFDPSSIVTTAEAQVALPKEIRKLDHLYQLKCRQSIGSDGLENQVVAAVGKARSLVVRCRRAGQECPAADTPMPSVDASGYAFELSDVDRDGRVEVIASRGQARGKRDRIRSFADKMVWDQWFTGGVIALGSADVDGNGSREVFAAIRLEGTKRFSLWQLNRHLDRAK